MARQLRINISAYGLCKTVGCSSAFDLTRNLDEARGMLRLAKAEGADLALLPEQFALQQCPDPLRAAEPLDGPTITMLQEEAARLRMGIAAGHILEMPEGKRNSLLLIGRSGEILALYHKTYPMMEELKMGIIPGSGAQTQETEFGRIGFAICFDLNFEDLRLAYRDREPDIILFSSYFPGGLQVRWWAFETRSHVASSCVDPGSVIVNPLGRVLARAGARNRSLTTTINLDARVFHLDGHEHRIQEAREHYGADLEIEYAEPEGVFLMSSTGDRTIRELSEKLRFESANSYFARVRSHWPGRHSASRFHPKRHSDCDLFL